SAVAVSGSFSSHKGGPSMPAVFRGGCLTGHYAGSTRGETKRETEAEPSAPQTEVWPMFRWLFGRPKHKSREYLHPGRLEDVIALIQVLGLDKSTKRGESALDVELCGTPASARDWLDVGRQHPEFFRVRG